jgi:hypothetical protein
MSRGTEDYQCSQPLLNKGARGLFPYQKKKTGNTLVLRNKPLRAMGISFQKPHILAARLSSPQASFYGTAVWPFTRLWQPFSIGYLFNPLFQNLINI